MLDKEQREKLLHDLKRAAKVARLIKEEKDAAKRALITDLLTDELDRLHGDIEEMTSGD